MITKAVQLRSMPSGEVVGPSRKKIGLLDHLGGGNLGDDATLDAVMQNIKSRWPTAEISGFSMNPSDTQKRHNIPAYPIRYQTWSFNDTAVSHQSRIVRKVKTAAANARALDLLINVFIRSPRALFRELRFLFRAFNIIRSFDYLLISGGGQLLDCWGGPWAFPYTLCKWVLLARLMGARCYFVNVGAGPVNSPLSKLLITKALVLADYVSFRDDDSKALAKQLGFNRNSYVFPDSVYSLDVCVPKHNTNCSQRSVEPLVGIAPMAYCDPRRYYSKDRPAYVKFIQTLSSFGSQLIRDGFRIALFSTDINFDSQAVEDLWDQVLRNGAVKNPEQITRPLVPGLDELLIEMSKMEYIVTCRFHGVIFAHLLNKPVLALSHHPKVTTIMKAVGLAEYCIQIDQLDAGSLQSVFRRLVDNRQMVRRQIEKAVRSYKKMLMNQFDVLFGPKVLHVARHTVV